MNLCKTNMTVLRGDFFWSQAHFVPSCDSHYRDASPRDFGPCCADCRIAINQTSNLDCGWHGSIITICYSEIFLSGQGIQSTHALCLEGFNGWKLFQDVADFVYTIHQTSLREWVDVELDAFTVG